MIAKIFIVFFGFCVISIAVLDVYFGKIAEIKTPEYDEIDTYMLLTPEIKPSVGKALEDNIISNHEFMTLGLEHKSILFQRHRDRIRQRALDN